MKLSRMRTLWLWAALAVLSSVSCTRDAFVFERRSPDPDLAPAVTTLVESWLGNTLSGEGGKFVPSNLSALHVGADGTTYVLCSTGRVRSGIYRSGEPVGSLEALDEASDRAGGSAIAGDGAMIFASVRQGSRGAMGPPDGQTWYAVARHFVDGRAAPFAGGAGLQRNLLVLDTEPVGLARRADVLLVTTAGGELQTYDADALKLRAKVAVASAGPIALDPLERVWMLQSGRVVQLDGTGAAAAALDAVTTAVAIAAAPDGLLVADAAAVVQRYDLLGSVPKLVATIGEPGGLAAAPAGAVRPLRFAPIRAVGAAANGTIVVGMNEKVNATGATTVVSAVDAGGTPLWQLSALVDHEGASVDPESDGTDVYTVRSHFRMDYSRAAGREATWRGATSTPSTMATDLRSLSSWGTTIVRTLNGVRYLFHFAVGDGRGLDHVGVYRVQDYAEAAVPVLTFGSAFAVRAFDGRPREGNAWIWTDADGDARYVTPEIEHSDLHPPIGMWVDERADIWRAGPEGITQFISQPTADGGVRYTFRSIRTWPVPPPFTGLSRVEIMRGEEVAFLAGATETGDGVRHADAAPSLARYDDWFGTPRLRFLLRFADDPVRSFWVAGTRLFVTHDRSSDVEVFDATSGAPVATLRGGWPGQPLGAPFLSHFGVTAHRRRNGEYLVFVENSAFSQIRLFRMPADWADGPPADRRVAR